MKNKKENWNWESIKRVSEHNIIMWMTLLATSLFYDVMNTGVMFVMFLLSTFFYNFCFKKSEIEKNSTICKDHDYNYSKNIPICEYTFDDEVTGVLYYEGFVIWSVLNKDGNIIVCQDDRMFKLELVDKFFKMIRTGDSGYINLGDLRFIKQGTREEVILHNVNIRSIPVSEKVDLDSLEMSALHIRDFWLTYSHYTRKL